MAAGARPHETISTFTFNRYTPFFFPFTTIRSTSLGTFTSTASKLLLNALGSDSTVLLVALSSPHAPIAVPSSLDVAVCAAARANAISIRTWLSCINVHRVPSSHVSRRFSCTTSRVPFATYALGATSSSIPSAATASRSALRYGPASAGSGTSTSPELRPSGTSATTCAPCACARSRATAPLPSGHVGSTNRMRAPPGSQSPSTIAPS
jgi:hypothetical protein